MSYEIPLTQFIRDFGSDLFASVSRSIPPVWQGEQDPQQLAIMNGLKRQPFVAQQDAISASLAILRDERAAILNGEMGTGKTLMAIAIAACLFDQGYRRSLILSPPHLVYKWRREILATLPNAQVIVLNGADTLHKLLHCYTHRYALATVPTFYILGRVRMRMGFTWQPAYLLRKRHLRSPADQPISTHLVCACPRCGRIIRDESDHAYTADTFPRDKPLVCSQCDERLWQLVRPRSNSAYTQSDTLKKALCQIPTIGPKKAESLMQQVGHEQLIAMLGDNLFEFINMMDKEGELVFSDRQAKRMEKSMGNMSFEFGQGGFQASEFIKRYLPNGYFDLLITDEAHEYKNYISAQGQAMGVLANKVRKVLLLTGTLMGGYADDIFHLLWRIMPHRMIEDGYAYQRSGLSAATTAFMRDHGILKEIIKVTDGGAHKTAKGHRKQVNTTKAPGFGPKGILRYVLPYTVFVKLKDLDAGILPDYQEFYQEIPMSGEQAARYRVMATQLATRLKQGLAKGDRSLLGVVLNVLLAWPDCAFKDETVKHPCTRELLTFVPRVFSEWEISPKEQALIHLAKAEKANGRRVLAYTVYTGTRDTGSRLKQLCTQAGLKVAVLRSTISPDKREDWIAEQVDQGIDLLICNPELVKTGLDLLDFATIVFMQTAYNVYTVQQAARRSWRIGQTQAVKVYFFGYAQTSQVACLSLMAKKIAVSQSTSGEMPETGLDILNQDDDSIEIALAKQLLESV